MAIAVDLGRKAINKHTRPSVQPDTTECYSASLRDNFDRWFPVRIITGMDRNAPEWASITGMDIKIYLFYATKFIILP